MCPSQSRGGTPGCRRRLLQRPHGQETPCEAGEHHRDITRPREGFGLSVLGWASLKPQASVSTSGVPAGNTALLGVRGTHAQALIPPQPEGPGNTALPCFIRGPELSHLSHPDTGWGPRRPHDAVQGRGPGWRFWSRTRLQGSTWVLAAWTMLPLADGGWTSASDAQQPRPWPSSSPTTRLCTLQAGRGPLRSDGPPSIPVRLPPTCPHSPVAKHPRSLILVYPACARRPRVPVVLSCVPGDTASETSISL